MCRPKCIWFQACSLKTEIARTRRHRIPRKQTHSPECGISKTLRNSMNGHELIEIAHKMCRPKCIWFQACSLKTEIARTRRHRIPRKQTHSPECGISKTLRNSMNGHELIEIAHKMCRPKCIWFQACSLKNEITRTQCHQIPQSYGRACGNAFAHVTSSSRSTHCMAGSNCMLKRKQK